MSTPSKNKSSRIDDRHSTKTAMARNDDEDTQASSSEVVAGGLVTMARKKIQRNR